jgi:hypothetical protein
MTAFWSCDLTEKKQSADAYDELANPDSLKNFAISDYNTENPDVKNIQRPSKSSFNSDIDTSLLFTIWTSDPAGPHADFVFSSKSFYVVDYDGDGDMPYEIKGRSLKIFYNDFVKDGQFVSVTADTLKIKWREFDFVNSYVKWTQ